MENKQPSDACNFPEFKFFTVGEVLKKLGRVIFKDLEIESGAAAELDRQLYDVPQITQDWLDYATLEQ